MKKVVFVCFVLFAVISCSKKEEVKFEAFSPEAFAYDIGDSWEINATVNVKGFVKKEVGDDLSASLEFTVDMIGPDSLTVTNIFSDSKEVTSSELIDVQLEAQFELDYNSPEGLYKINLNVTDINSGEVTSAQAEFELKK
ncbi:MAG: hypothetical protein OEM46_02215 [Ignavibacteria bacterium]|nr:hypothetical protein [Ignavibacteria bacterium]